MFKFLKDRKKKDNKGFTLVELVIVIAILAILVGILAPQYTKYVEKSRKSADVNNMDEIIRAIEVYYVDQGADSKLTDSTTITITMNADKKSVVTVSAQTGSTTTDLTKKEYIGEYLKNISNITIGITCNIFKTVAVIFNFLFNISISFLIVSHLQH